MGFLRSGAASLMNRTWLQDSGPPVPSRNMGAKGSTKTGGRKKGVPNKLTKELQDLTERLGVDPFEVLLMIAAGDWKGLGYPKGIAIGPFGIRYPTIDPSVRAKAASEACGYLFPKRKSIELSAPGLEDAIKALPDNQLDQRIKAAMERMKK